MSDEDEARLEIFKYILRKFLAIIVFLMLTYTVSAKHIIEKKVPAYTWVPVSVLVNTITNLEI